MKTHKEPNPVKDRLTINPDYLALVPRPTKQEYQALEQDILEKGQAHTPLFVNRHGVILDGHSRYRICKKHDLGYSLIVKEFDSEQDELLFVIECNLNRRQLTRFQRVELYLKYKEIISEKAKMNQVLAGQLYGKGKRVSRNQENQSITPVHTDETLAKRARVSKSTLYKAERARI